MDECDLTDDVERVHTESRIKLVCKAAAIIPKGEPGECRCCGEYSMRLVGGACAPCRDLRGLP